MAKKEILAAIRKAGRELGRTPSRGELKRLTGISHYRVLTQFRSLREAVRQAGLTPNAKGQRVSAEELMRDWERVKRKLGRRPSRAEYVREGRYSAGTFVARFGAWGNIRKLTTKDTKEHRGKTKISHELTRSTRIKPRPKELVHESDKALAFQWARSLSAIPGPLEGKRRVTELIAAMVVRTLLPAGSPASGSRQFTIGQNQEVNHKEHEGTQSRNGRAGAQGASFGHARRGLLKDRPVMGPPFGRHPLTNAPVNEMGVAFLWALMAWELGFQVEAMQGRYPDCLAKREVLPGKWQQVNVELEYESKNFLLHGHDPKKCDVIVCWRHNWKDAPEHIEIIALEELFRGL